MKYSKCDVIVTMFTGWNKFLRRFHSSNWIRRNTNLHKSAQTTKNVKMTRSRRGYSVNIF